MRCLLLIPTTSGVDVTHGGQSSPHRSSCAGSLARGETTERCTNPYQGCGDCLTPDDLGGVAVSLWVLRSGQRHVQTLTALPVRPQNLHSQVGMRVDDPVVQNLHRLPHVCLLWVAHVHVGWL